MLVGKAYNGHAEKGSAETAGVKPAETGGNVLLGAGDEGFVERVHGRVRTVVGTDKDGKRGRGENEAHYEGEVHREPRECLVLI